MAIALPPPKELQVGEEFESWLESVENYMTAVGVVKEAQNKSIVL